MVYRVLHNNMQVFQEVCISKSIVCSCLHVAKCDWGLAQPSPRPLTKQFPFRLREPRRPIISVLFPLICMPWWLSGYIGCVLSLCKVWLWVLICSVPFWIFAIIAISDGGGTSTGLILYVKIMSTHWVLPIRVCDWFWGLPLDSIIY
jgi:hypothetical protein